MPRNQATITTITASMTMSTDELFQLMSWLSPAFPVGAFSYSHGLEYAVEVGLVCDEATLESWVRTCLAQEFAPVSGLLLRAAYQAVAAHDSQALSVTLVEARALVPTPEFELECQAQGTAFMTTLLAAWPQTKALKDMERVLAQGWISYASAVGIAAAAANIPLKPTLAAYFHAVVSNLLSAGVRLIPLGQTAGQRILARLQGAVAAATQDALTREACNMGAAAPIIEWASTRHETQYTRLFRS
jgi:urease accessory protein